MFQGVIYLISIVVFINLPLHADLVGGLDYSKGLITDTLPYLSVFGFVGAFVIALLGNGPQAILRSVFIFLSSALLYAGPGIIESLKNNFS
jgi:hypothetical protein